jgi:hypothetical protein
MSREERLQAIATFPEHLRLALAAAANRAVPSGEWSPTEVVRHLIAVEDEVHLHRLGQIAVEDDPRWQWTEPGLATGFDGAGLAEVLEAFAALRASTVQLVQALDDNGWARHGMHATYGRLDVEGLLLLASNHDAEHLGALRG